MKIALCCMLIVTLVLGNEQNGCCPSGFTKICHRVPWRIVIFRGSKNPAIICECKASPPKDAGLSLACPLGKILSCQKELDKNTRVFIRKCRCIKDWISEVTIISPEESLPPARNKYFPMVNKVSNSNRGKGS